MSSPENRHAQVPKPTNYENTPSSDAAPIDGADRAFFDTQTPQDLSDFNHNANPEFIEHPQAGQPRTDGFGNNPQAVHYSEYRSLHEKKPLIRTRTIILGALAVSTVIGVTVGVKKVNEARELIDTFNAIKNVPSMEQSTDDIVIGEGSPLDSPSSIPTLEHDLNYDGVVNSDDFDLMPPSTYAQLPEIIRMEDSAARMKSALPSTIPAIQPLLSAEGRNLVSMPNLSTPPSQWSDQDYTNYMTLGIFLASAQGNTQEQINEGKRALSIVINPDDRLYDKVYDEIGSVASLLYTARAMPSEMSGINLKNGTTIDGVSVTGDGGRLIRTQWLYEDGKNESYLFYVNRRDSQGNILPMLARTFKRDDPALDQFIG